MLGRTATRLPKPRMGHVGISSLVPHNRRLLTSNCGSAGSMSVHEALTKGSKDLRALPNVTAAQARQQQPARPMANG